MSNKTKKSLKSIMKSRTRSIKDKSRMLVECILNKDPLTANKIFPGLVTESEDLRELEVKKLLLEDDEDWGDDDSDDDGTGDDEGDDDTGDDEGDDESGDDESGEEDDSDQADADTDKVIDDATEIKCQINAKVIENLFDTISDLKNSLNEQNLDETSKEFITLDTTISYYSDKLQELQAQTNPGTDQTKLEEKLDTITKALDELKEKANAGGDGDDEVEAPEDVEDSEQETDDESQDDTDEEGQEGQEDQEDYDEEGQDESEEGDEDQESDEDF